jgi:hypothetical protein
MDASIKMMPIKKYFFGSDHRLKNNKSVKNHTAGSLQNISAWQSQGCAEYS